MTQLTLTILTPKTPGQNPIFAAQETGNDIRLCLVDASPRRLCEERIDAARVRKRNFISNDTHCLACLYATFHVREETSVQIVRT